MESLKGKINHYSDSDDNTRNVIANVAEMPCFYSVYNDITKVVEKHCFHLLGFWILSPRITKPDISINWHPKSFKLFKKYPIGQEVKRKTSCKRSI